ncbi:hypothetical protein I3F58_27215 [Streptomyces sp. MUM 203J]|uniref:hypothetical protein n=1 Tax=Streptomyces sp. MUM 203J TaxID=2791990 RepID=UPI001F046552|nr:hypothetical protein [Streptomyces sp. MUM 203J]MCH0543176.1 hypothetical protein [Streptomyces sp. MUM 203J]
MSAPAVEQPTDYAIPTTVRGLPWDVYAGGDCLWCRQPLPAEGSRLVTRTDEWLGVHYVGADLFACPTCYAKAQAVKGAS